MKGIKMNKEQIKDLKERLEDVVYSLNCVIDILGASTKSASEGCGENFTTSYFKAKQGLKKIQKVMGK